MLNKESLSIILKQAWLLGGLLLLILFIQINTSLTLYSNLYQNYVNRLDTLYSVDRKVPLRDLCNSISCVSVLNEDNKVLYVNESGKLYFSYDNIPPDISYLGYLNKDFFTIVNYKDFKFYIDDRKIIYDTAKSILIIFSLCALIIILLLILYIGLSYKSKKMEYVNIRRKLELVAQRDITEILHHEMNLPMAVITDGVNNIKNEIKDLINNRKDDKELTSIRTNMVKELEDMLLAIDSINVVLKLIGNNKTIKQTNGNLSVLDVFDRAIINCNAFNLGKICYKADNKDILTTNSISYPLNNGELYNIFKVLINNSMEAKASEITLSASYDTKKNFLRIFLKDNGPGITDSSGKPLKDNNVIFEYGYSTKNNKRKNITMSKFIMTVVNWFFNLNLSNTYETGRGYGLYLNKKIIEEAKGSIYVSHSDRNGTLFVIIIPIKKTQHHH